MRSVSEHTGLHGEKRNNIGLLQTRCRLFALCAAALGLLSSTPASAGQVLSVDAKGGFSNLISINASFNGIQGSFYAGIQSASLNGNPAFDGYCVDLYHDNYVPVSYPVSLVPIAQLNNPPLTSGATGGNGAKIGYLCDTYASGASNDKVKAAALQVAIWTAE
jgi:hypothetical protein